MKTIAMRHTGADTQFANEPGAKAMAPSMRGKQNMKIPMVAVSSTLGLLISFCCSSEAFEIGDEVVTLTDTPANFYDKGYRIIKEGEKIRVAKHDKTAGRVYFILTVEEGKQIALNMPENMVETASEYAAQKDKASSSQVVEAVSADEIRNWLRQDKQDTILSEVELTACAKEMVTLSKAYLKIAELLNVWVLAAC